MVEVWCRETVPENVRNLAEKFWGQSVSPDSKCELRTADHTDGMHRAAGRGGNMSWAIGEPRESVIDARKRGSSDPNGD